MKKKYLCIHGHFYQPPRENPWIEDIEPQEGASPYHDWNERIFHECYFPNSRARVLRHDSLIEDIVNNFEKISFNFGPTLMSWLAQKHPETYARILEADRQSLEQHRGHGNAIAQVYNHMIMPLASRRDKVTQVRWGLREFRYRFGRDAESIWLSETACNEETLEVLAGEGIKFVILEPHQAEAFRPIGGEWKNVSNGEIDPKRPYRCFLKNDPSRFVDIFFYDGPISKAIGFENLLADARFFIGRIEGAVIADGEGPQLIHMATDGETYGHHKAFGDRVLAYLLNVEAVQKNYRITNYGAHLEEHPPQFEVRIKEGENGEGTSWSCAHGVRRWKDHCGCRGGGPAEWTQHWRKPLRDSLDWLRDRLAELYEQQALKYLTDVWAARNDYIEVILDRSPANIQAFLSRHRKQELRPHEITACLKLLEMQRYAMLMYTSCGWFFTELSGIETVQILQYAARAIQLAREVTGENHEEAFLERLAEAKSNLEQYKDGRGVYDQLVRRCVASLEHIVSYYAIGSMFEDYYPHKEKLSIYCFDLQIGYQRQESYGSLNLNLGHVRIHSRITLEEKDFVFAVVRVGTFDFRCSVKPYTDMADLEKIEKMLFYELHESHIVELFKRMDALFGEKYFDLKDLLLEDRMKIISRLTKKQIENISRFYERVYDESRRINEIYHSIHLPIPPEFRYAAQHVLSKRILEELQKLSGSGFATRKAHAAYRFIDAAKSFNVEIQKTTVSQFLSQELNKRIEAFAKAPSEVLVGECIRIHKLAGKIEAPLDLWAAQDRLFFLVKSWKSRPETIPQAVLNCSTQFLQLLTRLGLSGHELKHLLVGSPA